MIIDLGLSSNLNFSSISSEADFTGVQSITSTTANNEYPYKDSIISANLIFSSCCSAAHQTGRKPTKVCLSCTGHRLYILRGSLAGRHEPDKPLNLNLSSKRQFLQKISRQSQRTTLEMRYCNRSEGILRQLLFSSLENCAIFIGCLKTFVSVGMYLKVGCPLTHLYFIFEYPTTFHLFPFDTVVAPVVSIDTNFYEHFI